MKKSKSTKKKATTKRRTPSEKLEYLFRNRKRIWKSISKALDAHGDGGLKKLKDYKIKHPRIWNAQSMREKRKFVKEMYPYLTETQLEAIVYSYKMWKKYGYY